MGADPAPAGAARFCFGPRDRRGLVAGIRTGQLLLLALGARHFRLPRPLPRPARPPGRGAGPPRCGDRRLAPRGGPDPRGVGPGLRAARRRAGAPVARRGTRTPRLPGAPCRPGALLEPCPPRVPAGLRATRRCPLRPAGRDLERGPLRRGRCLRPPRRVRARAAGGRVVGRPRRGGPGGGDPPAPVDRADRAGVRAGLARAGLARARRRGLGSRCWLGGPARFLRGAPASRAGGLRHELLLVCTVRTARVLLGRRGRRAGRPTVPPASLEQLAGELDSLERRCRDAGVAVEGALSSRGLAAALRRSTELAPREPPPGASPFPARCEASWSSLRTGSLWHCTYWVEEWPRHDVRSDFLLPLLLDHRDRRSLSLVMAPLPPGRAVRAAEHARTSGAADAELRRRHGFALTARSRPRAGGGGPARGGAGRGPRRVPLLRLSHRERRLARRARRGPTPG